MQITRATDQTSWDGFLGEQRFSPFLQSWTMGDVYGDLNQTAIRLTVQDGDRTVGICQAIVVPARRGKHLSVPYGPILTDRAALTPLLAELRTQARAHGCSFIRFSPHWPLADQPIPHTTPAPLHLLAEHLWYLPLREKDPWADATAEHRASGAVHDLPQHQAGDAGNARSEEDVLKGMRSTARNLIRRAEREGVTIERSTKPLEDVEHFIRLHDETRKRHHFTPYSNSFFRAQVRRFAPRNQCTVYLAHYQGQVIAASIHMHMGGETSYHHGASSTEHRKIPASYLLQWQALRDARDRGDAIYNFWGIAPTKADSNEPQNPAHPFAGVTLFKTGFGGRLLNLQHCSDLPLSPAYHLTRLVEQVRKWKRGF